MNLHEYKERLYMILSRNIVEFLKEIDKVIILESNSGIKYIQLKGSFNDIKKQDTFGLISTEDNFTFKNKIRNGLLNLIEELQENELKIFSTQTDLAIKNSLVKAINQIIDDEKDSNAFLKSLLIGNENHEYQNLILDEIKFKRFKNQVKIFSKAKKIVEKHGLSPKVIPLKILTPLIEYSSLEEEESLQEKWSNLIANISLSENKNSLKRNCIEILNKLSGQDVKFLDALFSYLENHHKTRSPAAGYHYSNISPRDYLIFSMKAVPVYLYNVEALKEYNSDKNDYIIDNLIRLGLIKWDVPVIDMDNRVSTIEDIDVELSKPDSIKITDLGIKFIELCKS